MKSSVPGKGFKGGKIRIGMCGMYMPIQDTFFVHKDLFGLLCTDLSIVGVVLTQNPHQY